MKLLVSNEKDELIISIVENETVKKLKILEEYVNSSDVLKKKISTIALKQKNAISSNDQDLIADVLNELDELSSDINIQEYLNTQEEINELLLNIKNIIESNLKG